ncbi:NAD(P)-binding protein [Sporormia fimetaria CBS 119925]|uniref:NAD(P)-binding protein n=1 Tax=Sporormia fimetaria CBS 119925 TaxID=1340428 RepID=A0A6A6VGW5_9PLEO|nr:NAD(P)-binding protein [Sporormia fimetaria CBS 119925]
MAESKKYALVTGFVHYSPHRSQLLQHASNYHVWLKPPADRRNSDVLQEVLDITWRLSYEVLATVRNPSTLTSPHPKITYLPLELTSQESIAALKDRVTNITNGRLDILYNNAGRNYTVPALDFSTDELQELFQANVFSVMAMCKAFTPLLIAAKGTIVQTGSIAALMPYAWGACYCASKAALHAYSDTLRVELAPFGVRVITVITGGVKSNIARVDRELPSDSYMLPLKDEYKSRLTHSQQVGMDTQSYARRCVRQVTRQKRWWGVAWRRWVWEGKMSWVVWFVRNWVPGGAGPVLDWYFMRRFGLGRLRGEGGKKVV